MTAISLTNFTFPQQTGFYRGKVRDVYYFDDRLVMVATDRISAFDVVLDKAIPYKGKVLNTIAAKFLASTKHIVPNWVNAVPHSNVTIGKRCAPFPIEMVVRAYLVGHAWRVYREGKRTLCGVALPEGLKPYDRLPKPIITPTTKADKGHDQDITEAAIIEEELVSAEDYAQLATYSTKLFAAGQVHAQKQQLILADTKYEFGKYDGKIYLIDEIHTPDSSRYFYAKGYDQRQQSQQPQKELSKEFIRQWLINRGFQGGNRAGITRITR